MTCMSLYHDFKVYLFLLIYLLIKYNMTHVRSLFYSYNTYIVIVCPIESHYFYCCALTLVLLYYWCQLVSFHCSCILWTPIYTEKVLSFGSSCFCESMWCIRRLPHRSGLLSNFLSLSCHEVLILNFLCYFVFWFIAFGIRARWF